MSVYFQNKLSLWAPPLLGAMLCCSVTAVSQQTGRLRIDALPPTAHVYVDAHPVTTYVGTVSLPPGWHRVQVEQRDESGVRAYRRFVQIVRNETVSMPLIWHTVQVCMPEEVAAFRPPPPGPAGIDGPPARAYQPFPPNVSVGGLEASLHIERNRLMDDFEAQMDAKVNSLHKFAYPTYFYVKGAPVSKRAGLPVFPGPQGPPGREGIPAEVKLILTPKGEPVFDVMAQRLGLSQIQEKLKTLQRRIVALSKTPTVRQMAVVPEPLQVLTPAWKSALDREWNERVAMRGQGRGLHFDWVAPIGAQGRRGPDGVPPADAVPVRLTDMQEAQLLEMLTTGDFLAACEKHLNEKLMELTERVYVAEALHLEQFPPPSLRRPRQKLHKKPRSM